MPEHVIVAGISMIPFKKPGDSADYRTMGSAAAKAALEDAGVSYSDVKQAYAGYVYGDSTSGQAALYPVGLSGIPIVNVNNNCATGSTALFLARQVIANGVTDCVIALGFEQMSPGSLASVYKDRPDPLADFLSTIDERFGTSDAPMALRLFGGAALDYQERYGASDETFAMITEKARKHAGKNPHALLRAPITVEEVLASPKMFGPLTRFQCCPPTCGAAAAILCNEEFAKKHNINGDIVIKSQAFTTDEAASFDKDDLRNTVGAGMSRKAAEQVYTDAGINPEDLDVIELHDCFTANELLSYESLMLTPEGTAERFIRDGNNTYGGQFVVNPSGGLLAKGHPLGATGLAQCYELTSHLRGSAGERQVERARLALQHNIGLGGACVVTLYENTKGHAR
ncbi:lipid-transfer protein [Kordiimonas pumila]|uniref:propanoyl-CoA C-acyltransferase n=1 Tax=Kordiimonas pumila TaxID=2161677 RepID=A0ABV7D932_9PROT|nr:lipid-transfer protein [Kordiimonas pumila]